MIVITLGTQASGSTWLFNVVLALFDAVNRPVFSCFAEDGLDLLDKLPLGVEDAVIKEHALDQRLLRIARLSGARVLVTTRDPLDSIVSQSERFGTNPREAITEVGRAFATIRSLPDDLAVLEFSYEKTFTKQLRSISEIAAFLELNVNPMMQSRIFHRLVPDKVKALIAARLAGLPNGVEPSHDPIAHWHPGHVGDGRTGKWLDRLDPKNQSLIRDCLSPLASSAVLKGKTLRWPANLFSANTDTSKCRVVTFACTGDSSDLCWGPYLHLPSGRWRAIPRLYAVAFSGIQIEADVFSPWSGRCLTQAYGSVSIMASSELTLEFDHIDHYEPLELRLHNFQGVCGTLEFFGWQLEYLRRLEGCRSAIISSAAA